MKISEKSFTQRFHVAMIKWQKWNMLNSFVQIGAYCQNLSKKRPYKIFIALKPNSEKLEQ